ncbi:hypothetical protein LIA77_04178 [Sarocladium implicatum]|nr:hypothetical protein LIA77_04178 [Sarocladium implicatum]
MSVMLRPSTQVPEVPYPEAGCRSPAGAGAGIRGHRMASARTCWGAQACIQAGRRKPWEERRTLHGHRNRHHHHGRSRHREDQCPKPCQRESVGRRICGRCVSLGSAVC